MSRVYEETRFRFFLRVPDWLTFVVNNGVGGYGAQRGRREGRKTKKEERRKTKEERRGKKEEGRERREEIREKKEQRNVRGC